MMHPADISTDSVMATECVFPISYKVVMPILLGLTALLSPVLNSLVCLTICRTKKLRTNGNILIANLALSDAVIGILLAPLEIVYVAYFPAWPIGRGGTYALNAVFLFSLVSPFVIVTIITVERYVTIKSFSVAADQNMVSKRALMFCIAGIWVYSIAAIAFMTGNFTDAKENYYTWNVKPSFYYPFLGLHIVIPLSVVCLAYHKIFKITKSAPAGNLESSVATRSFMQSRELKLAKTLGIVIGLLFLVWLPVLIIECFYATESTSCVTEAAGPVSVWLTVTSGVINPLVYFYRNPNLLVAFYQALRLKRNHTASQLTVPLVKNNEDGKIP